MVGLADDAPRSFFAFGVPSRLIRIIGLQNSSGPSPQPPPAVRDYAPLVRLLPLPWAAQFSGMGQTTPPASKTPAAATRLIRELWTSRPPGKSSRYALLTNWRGRSRMSSEFRAR